jgi:enoyl-CoA hydratase/carnithine racemase/thioesterase domain-containing protein
MYARDIFSALRSGAISAEDAEKALLKRLGASPAADDPPSEQSPAAPVVDVQEVEPGIALVTMQDRQHKNTFSMELIMELFQAFQALQANPRYKVAILTGYESYFASGGSREGLLALYEGKVKLSDVPIYSLPLECEIPVIAAMQGHALGGGWCLGLFCDFVVLSRESSYACNHMHYGFTPGDGATLILPEKLGPVLAREMLFTGQKYRGAELEARGVSLPIVPRKEVLASAFQLARRLAEAPRQALVLLKAHMAAPLKKQLPAVLEQEWQMQQQTLVEQPAVLQKMLAAFDPAMNGGSQRSNGAPIFAQEPLPQEEQVSAPARSLLSVEARWPELILLKRSHQGRPVFWFHGEGGGVEGYQLLARTSQRPFYGIQAPGRVRPVPALQGIPALAGYYIQLIQDIQPAGPYDLGGYSLGGMLAYEAARQLQRTGHSVQTLCLVDTLDTQGLQRNVVSWQTRILQAVNMSLINRLRLEPEKLLQKLINNQAIAADLNDDELLRQLIRLGRERGLSLSKTESELFALFQTYLQTQAAFQENLFTIEPLPDPQAVECCYFRNKSGVFYGAFQPYLTGPADMIALDHTNYWQEWEQHLPNCQMIDVDASNHITLLFEPAASQTLAEYCQRLYIL